MQDTHFLILRCHPRDTLPIPQRYPDLNLLCPTTQLSVRRGPHRLRQTVLIPILPSFLFLPVHHPFPTLTTLTAPSIPISLRSRLHLMRRPHMAPTHPHIFNDNNPLPVSITRTPPSIYAYTTLREISVMMTHVASLPTSDPHSFQVGSNVEVTSGLLSGCTGIVAQIKNNGDITLNIQQHLGWQFNTCIVNASVLRLCS
jgi:hypothetical protein